MIENSLKMFTMLNAHILQKDVQNGTAKLGFLIKNRQKFSKLAGV